MALKETLERVDADLAAGRVPLARQRLRGLVSSYPHHPVLRRCLADIYRLYGDPAEAGRWTYLEEDRLPEEVAAFEERYSDPVRRMRALAWQGQESAADSPFVEQQLAAVRTAASKALGQPVTWDTLVEVRGDAPEAGSFRQSLAVVGCALLAIVFAAIWVNGFLDLFR
ncbi:hypothetical protein OG936_11050 [Streptomyces sp. NBC_00846]|uniref:DUF6584 family protein n=1 Tax=Streptomyces sp. NBC_00846 TaxID=2975849 RepID=UPI003865F122|nr:hypothetical protein OG936_11050 [Streptomyces sp. NBC_00846]